MIINVGGLPQGRTIARSQERPELLGCFEKGEIEFLKPIDTVVEMTGNPQAIKEAFTAVRKGGRFSAFGIPSQPITLDLNNWVIFKGVTIYGINGRQLWQSWYQMAGLFRSGALDPRPVITHRIANLMIERIDLVHTDEMQGIKVKWRELGWDALIGEFAPRSIGAELLEVEA